MSSAARLTCLLLVAVLIGSVCLVQGTGTRVLFKNIPRTVAGVHHVQQILAGMGVASKGVEPQQDGNVLVKFEDQQKAEGFMQKWERVAADDGQNVGDTVGMEKIKVEYAADD